jgi:hypothetical protein
VPDLEYLDADAPEPRPGGEHGAAAALLIAEVNKNGPIGPFFYAPPRRPREGGDPCHAAETGPSE